MKSLVSHAKLAGVLAPVAILVASCGQTKTAEGPPETAADQTGAAEQKPQSEEPGAPNVPWEQKTRQQRMEYMGLYVLPKMKTLFQEFNPQSYEDFKCQTCHGEDMEQVDFEMPNALYALPPADPMKEAMDYDADTAKFMMEKVVPTMAELLDEPPFDPETGEGFGCFNCHLKEE